MRIDHEGSIRTSAVGRSSPAYRLAALPFGVTPSSALVEVSDDELRARFGPWRVAGALRHPGLTVTVADCDGLLARLVSAGVAPS